MPHLAFNLKSVCPTLLPLPLSCQGHLFFTPSFVSLSLGFSRSLFTLSLAWLPVFLSICSWHWVPFIRCPSFSLSGYFARCSSPEPAAVFLSKVCIVTALTLHCLGRPSSHMGQEAHAPGRLRPGFSCFPCFCPRTSPGGRPGPAAGRPGSRTGHGPERRQQPGLASPPPPLSLAERMSKKNGYLWKLASKFPV